MDARCDTIYAMSVYNEGSDDPITKRVKLNFTYHFAFDDTCRKWLC